MASQMKNMSLFIPHIFANYTKQDVIKVFEEEYQIGKVNHIDFIKKYNNGTEYYAGYVHFDYWNENPVAIQLQEDILDVKKEAHIMYEDPWYWIVLENKTNKQVTKPGERKIRIDITGFLNCSSTACDINTTPPRKIKAIKCPDAPRKIAKYDYQSIWNDESGTNLNYDFDEEDEARVAEFNQEEEARLAKIEKEIYEIGESMENITIENKDEALQEVLNDEQYLINIDCRYIEEMEHENSIMRDQIYYLQTQMHTLQMFCLQNGLTLPLPSPDPSPIVSPSPSPLQLPA
jgi:hypothetical protein